MPDDVPVAKNTLKGYDIVLAISQDAINNQLELLSKTPVSRLPLPKPGTKQPAPDYLASCHVSTLFRKPIKESDGSSAVSNTVIFGWIEPPKVIINGGVNMTARVNLTFRTNPQPEDHLPSVSSTYTHWKDDVMTDHVVINGWTLGWEADLTSTDIRSIEEKLIALPSETVSTLKAHVDSRDFLVSSIFCLTTNEKLLHTFEATDANGKRADLGTWADGFTQAMSKWVLGDPAPVGKSSDIKGLPTRHNPFVLGYGIRQATVTEAGPPLFIPRDFQFSTSTDEEDPRKSTLNFCMTTEPYRWLDDETWAKAGQFSPSFMRKLAVNPAEGDGVMAISAGAFLSHFIKPLFVDNFEVDFRSDVEAFLANNGIELGIIPQQRVEDNPSRRRYFIERRWDTELLPHNVDRDSVFELQERTRFEGSSQVVVDWTSDAIPLESHNSFVQRRIYITVISSANVTIKNELSDRYTEMWSEDTTTYLRVNLEARYIIYASSEGKWTITLDKTQGYLPEIGTDSDGKPHLLYKNSRPPTDDSPGVYIWTNKYGFFNFFTLGWDDGMVRQMNAWATLDLQKLNERLTSIIEMLKTKIIMPSGNVFMFKGLNLDENGHVYSPVFYASSTQGSRIE